MTPPREGVRVLLQKLLTGAFPDGTNGPDLKVVAPRALKHILQ